MANDTTVLIVGAGPTGLMMAMVLQRYGIAFRIIEKKSAPTKTSNALGLHARSLELLDDLEIIEPFLKVGKKIHAASLHIDAKPLAKIDLAQLNSAYPFVLIVPQSQTEQILDARLNQLGVSVERNIELTNLQKNANSHQVSINGAEDFNCQWIIACDGARSTVRELAQVPFKGRDIEQQFVLADVTAKTSIPSDQLSVYYTREGVLAVFPMESGEIRLVADSPGHAKNPDEVNIETITQNRADRNFKITANNWQSTFWIHSKVIEKMRADRIFFCGDAAHIHSPAGGQGMNTGMQDAYNLGWKLAFVINGIADPNLLDSYQEERLPVVREMVKQTDRLTRMMLTKNPLKIAIRNCIMRPLLNTAKINRKLANQLSMLAIHYPKSSNINYPSVIGNRSPQPGDLVPEVKLLQPYSLSHYLRGKDYYLLIFTGRELLPQQLTKIETIIQDLEKNAASYLKPIIITPKPINVITTQISDDDFAIHNQFAIERAALCLIRPDKYIAYCSHYLNQKGLNVYLAMQKCIGEG